MPRNVFFRNMVTAGRTKTEKFLTIARFHIHSDHMGRDNLAFLATVRFATNLLYYFRSRRLLLLSPPQDASFYGNPRDYAPLIIIEFRLLRYNLAISIQ